jgi:xanthine dehydrogenase accessory factor
MDIFIEPMLPRPRVLVCGGSPVAVALADLLPRFGFSVAVAADRDDHPAFAEPDTRLIGYEAADLAGHAEFVVIATQGRGDEAALRAVLSVMDGYVAFVGSRRKAAALREALSAGDIGAERLARLRAPAGLDLGAVTPEEIALSIVAEIVAFRRQRATVALADSELKPLA